MFRRPAYFLWGYSEENKDIENSVNHGVRKPWSGIAWDGSSEWGEQNHSVVWGKGSYIICLKTWRFGGLALTFLSSISKHPYLPRSSCMLEGGQASGYIRACRDGEPSICGCFFSSLRLSRRRSLHKSLGTVWLAAWGQWARCRVAPFQPHHCFEVKSI